MLRWTGAAGVWAVLAAVVLQSPVHTQTSDSPLPVSVDRIRAALNAPPPVLQMPAWSGDTPTFRVEVRQQHWAGRPIEEPPFDPTLGLPSVGELLMGGIERIRSAVVSYKRDRAERRARREVDEALAAFCAVRGCPGPDSAR